MFTVRISFDGQPTGHGPTLRAAVPRRYREVLIVGSSVDHPLLIDPGRARPRGHGTPERNSRTTHLSAAAPSDVRVAWIVIG